MAVQKWYSTKNYAFWNSTQIENECQSSSETQLASALNFTVKEQTLPSKHSYDLDSWISNSHRNISIDYQ